MNAISDFRTVTTVQPKLPPAPPRAPVGFTLEALKADAKAAQARLHHTWYQAIPSQPKPTPSIRVIRWTPEKDAALQKEMLAILRKGPASVMEMLARLKSPANRHKVAATLTELRKAGKVTSRKVSNVRQEWSV